MATLELRGVVKRYGDVRILHGVDLTVADAEFVVIVGPSGCGKSTLLRMVAGLEDISDGEIRIGDRVVNTLEPKDRDIAMVFQNYALYPHMSVRQNMAYGLKIRGFSKDEIAARVAEAARVLELDQLLDRRPRNLSGGQRQRVAMGRAIVRHPQVFLFDEPLSNLDARLRVQMRLELRRLHQRLRVTSLYVTHDQVEAMTLGQRIVVMNAGRVEQIGTPNQIYETPASTFVASFIGSPPMNLFRATFSASGEFLTFSGAVDLRLAAARAELGGATIWLGLRPEQLQFGPPAPTALPMQVDLVESLGADNLVHGLVEGQPVVVRTGSAPPEAGSTVHLHWASGREHWFDVRDGGARIALG
ncbi:sn-glycerol-3-phosphate import ATP-binding protein UgpC [soil metagenome]